MQDFSKPLSSIVVKDYYRNMATPQQTSVPLFIMLIVMAEEIINVKIQMEAVRVGFIGIR